MKKICLLAFFVLFFLLSFNIVFATSNVAAAQEINPTPTPQSNYELPYPGLLPDSPIYFLRAIRDKMVGFLISDPLKKAEFDLLQADKRLNAGIYLFNSAKQNDSTEKNDKKIKLAVSTISKAENYFEQALQKIKEAKGQGMETTKITNKLIDSTKKHLELLKSLEEKSPKNFKSSFDQELQRVDKFGEEAIALTLKELKESK